MANYLTASIDHQADPGKDFYQYAVGRWLKKAKIPADRPTWNFFVQQTEKNYQILRRLCRKAGSARWPKSEAKKVGTFFRVGMRSSAGSLKYLKPLLERINNINSPSDLSREIARLQIETCDPFFSFGGAIDPGNSKMMIADLAQGGLTFPDRDYYLTPANRALREAFLSYARKVFGLLEKDKAAADQAAKTVLKIETELARASMDKTTMRDPHQTFHIHKVGSLNKLCPAVDWSIYFGELKIKIRSLNIAQPEFFRKFNSLILSLSLREIKVYLTWHLIDSLAPFLSDDFFQGHFDFHKRALLGLESPSPRWKRVIDAINLYLGEAAGKMYVENHFPPSAKRKMLSLCQQLIWA